MTQALTSGYAVKAPKTATLGGSYRVCTTADLHLVKFAQGDDPWSEGMNTNLDKIDTQLKNNDDAVSAALLQAQEVGNSIVSGSGNLLLNPEFSLWQRGTSADLSSGIINRYAADQWRVAMSSLFDTAYARQGPSINSSTSSIEVVDPQAVGGSSSPGTPKTGYIYQRLERPKAFRGQSLTFAADLQFLSTIAFLSAGYVEASVSIVDDAGSTTSTAWVPTFDYTNLKDTTRAVVTRSIDSSATYVEVRINFKIFYGGDLLIWGIWRADFRASNCMLSVGSSTALAYSPRPEAEELLLCQRYYQLLLPGSHTASEYYFSALTGEEFYWPLLFTPMYSSTPTVTVQRAAGPLTLTTSTGNANSVIAKFTKGGGATQGDYETAIVLESTFF